MYLLLFFMFWSNAETPNVPTTDSTKIVCEINAGDVGSIKFRGTSQEYAREQTARACLRARVRFFRDQRGASPSTDRRIEFMEGCVNETHCR